MKPLEYFQKLVTKTDQDVQNRAAKIITPLYHFIRSLECVLERGDLNEILIEQETTIVASCSKWLGELAMHEQEHEEHEEDMINYFNTFNNRARFKLSQQTTPTIVADQNGNKQNGDDLDEGDFKFNILNPF